MDRESHVLNHMMNREYPSIVRAENIYLYDEAGKRYMDAGSGPVTCSLGYGLEEMGQAMLDQVRQVAFVFRADFTTPVLQAVAGRICEKTGGDMDRVFMVSGGSEATEIAIKIARKYHIDNGEASRRKVISRWLSYHGSTMGALSWTGMPERRADNDPMLADCPHVAPAYCYRCWFNRRPDTCSLECAQALENEILCQGPATVAAFIMEPVGGSGLAGAYPRRDYFKEVREICDRHGVLLVFDEVLTGFGRTGSWFGYQHFDVVPDIIATGKGMGGGYFPVGAALVTARVAATIADNSGMFLPGHTWAGNPIAAAVVARVLDYMDAHGLVERAADRGEYLRKRLEGLADHPTVGDVRGLGLMWGVEFVRDRHTREPLDAALGFSHRLAGACLDRGLYIPSGGRCERGRAGDAIIFSPPFITTEKQIDDMVDLFDEVLTAAEKGISR